MVAKSVLDAPKCTPLRLIMMMRTYATFFRIFMCKPQEVSRTWERVAQNAIISQRSPFWSTKCIAARLPPFSESNHFIIEHRTHTGSRERGHSAVRDGCRLRAELIEIDKEPSLMSLKVLAARPAHVSKCARGGNRFSCAPRPSRRFHSEKLLEKRKTHTNMRSASRKSVSIVHASQHRIIMQRAVNKCKCSRKVL